MKLALVVLVFSTLSFAITPTLAISMSKPGCPEKCGDVTIPYPFGIGYLCSANPSFAVICKYSAGNSTRMVPFLNIINLEIVNVSIYGVVIVNLPVSSINCSEGQRRESLPISLSGSPFTVSAHYNTLVVLGCKNAVWLHDNGKEVGGCLAMCDDANSTDALSCNGVNCCKTSIPRRVHEFEFTYQSIQTSNSSLCGYVFPVDKKWMQNGDYKRYKGLVDDLSNPSDREFGFVPLVLEWEYGNERTFYNLNCSSPSHYGYQSFDEGSCKIKITDPFEYHTDSDYSECGSLFDYYQYQKRYLSYYHEYEYVSSTEYCTCSAGYEGNPYMFDGCQYPDGLYNNNRSQDSIKIPSIIIGSVFGGLLLLTTAWKFGKTITEMIQSSGCDPIEDVDSDGLSSISEIIECSSSDES
ncbi:hypothetical protein SASPL_151356 [Salvia splendens]|uniref:Wall-associated receptor kinase galacturonan-binding domain-containing protein n=1 Tax=Salvia splendens TaxID=180675 RepID=A0A8X8W987_SALSN|nr:hypothetical protein SASPL_151356 [Salvia splendens]